MATMLLLPSCTCLLWSCCMQFFGICTFDMIFTNYNSCGKWGKQESLGPFHFTSHYLSGQLHAELKFTILNYYDSGKWTLIRYIYFLQVACGKQAGAVTCLLDERGRYISQDFARLDLTPDFKVSSLNEVYFLLESSFDLTPWFPSPWLTNGFILHGVADSCALSSENPTLDRIALFFPLFPRKFLTVEEHLNSR